MTRPVLFLCLMVAIVTACSDSEPVTDGETSSIDTVTYQNSFADETLRTIAELQDRRDATGLSVYLKDANPEYRAAAAEAYGSFKTIDLSLLAPLLSDPDPEVVTAAAYSMGQSRDEEAVEALAATLPNTSGSALVSIYEAMGKCISNDSLFVMHLESASTHDLGASLMMYRYALGHTLPNEAVTLGVSILEGSKDDYARIMVAQAFSRSRDLDLSDWGQNLVAICEGTSNLELPLPLTRAIGKVKKTSVNRDFFTAALASEGDYRAVVQAIRACQNYDYHWCGIEIVKLLQHENVNVQIAAAEYFVAKEAMAPERMIAEAKKAENWRVAALLWQAGLKRNRNRAKAEKVIEAFHASTNDYEKGALLLALSEQPDQLKMLGHEMIDNTSPIVRSYAMDALSRMRASDAFAEAQKDWEDGKGGMMNFQQGFDIILRGALESGDPAVIAQAAPVYRNPDYGYLESLADDIDFLTEALNALELPAEIEAWQELKRTTDYFEGKTETVFPDQPFQNAIDWHAVAAIPSDQQVTIETSKGNIVLQLHVDEAPGSVASFVKLIEEGYHNGKAVHRVVPDFVMQGGCPRGDGWGSPNFSIRSEFPQGGYTTGSVGMASAGPDTESSQWFITHSPTPHLDGRYTIFAHVTAGMEVVHQFEVGDVITKMTLD